ncbi:hypothetical protein Zm00014a_011696 [Zea mays]|uniref:DUF4220 domain-containing protein n=1 Tax=Zea mays TaxID=4577 RepID=A0A3L6FZN6_MAIZE|nr:hypothetical protein Zm00014a_011696 [Zea mays]
MDLWGGGHCFAPMILSSVARQQSDRRTIMDPRSAPTWACPSVAVAAFYGTMGRRIWLGNAMLLASAAMTGVMVGVGGGSGRHRHRHRLARLVFLGANTLFLPVVSYVVSTLRDSANDYVNKEDGTTLAALCHSVFHPCMVITWAFLVQMAATSAASAAGSREVEGRTKAAGPPWELLVKAVWTFYLGASITNKRFFRGLFRVSPSANHGPLTLICSKVMFAPFLLICAKIWLRCYSFRKARKSFALGRNPGLVFGYMEELQRLRRSQRQRGGTTTTTTTTTAAGDGGQDAVLPPPLLVMGEDSKPVKKRPRGYVFSDAWTMPTDGGSTAGLVTLDRVWELDSVAPTSKDLCLSFALFKLLRCRLARYDDDIADVVGRCGATGHNEPLWTSLLLKDDDGDEQHGSRVFRVIADELSFVHDYYNSSLPTSYAKCWLPAVSVLVSLLSIGYCAVAAYFIAAFAGQVHRRGRGQINCEFWCSGGPTEPVSRLRKKEFGSLYFDVLPEFLLLVLVVIAEARDIASYACSNWTKVAIICHHVRREQEARPRRRRWFALLLLRCRCQKVVSSCWEEKMGQCSVLLALRPTAAAGANFLGRLSRRVFRHLADEKVKVEVPAAVKACVVDALTRATTTAARQVGVGGGAASLQRSQAGKGFLWACNGRTMSTADVMLTWHIATCVFEVRHPCCRWEDTDTEQGSSSPRVVVPVVEHRSAATHLSRYCAYLMTWAPELLPDEVAWTKSLYEAVKEDAERVLDAARAATAAPAPPLMMPDDEYQDLVALLSERSSHVVVKNGARLGRQLVELVEGEETAWAILAGFWAEMILYVAPSNNLKGHRKAIARGGELVTLLWALLFHAGIHTRPASGVGV